MIEKLKGRCFIKFMKLHDVFGTISEELICYYAARDLYVIHIYPKRSKQFELESFTMRFKYKTQRECIESFDLSDFLEISLESLLTYKVEKIRDWAKEKLNEKSQ